MNNVSPSQQLVTFSQATKTSFLQYLRDHPSNRRVSPNERERLIEWLTNPRKRPSSQQEFSRRNYARRTFAWDEEIHDLFVFAKNEEEKDRIVITEDMIADVVESVHERNGHAGWDATWRDISASYHGILRSDVIFLLKRCQVCVHDPSKRPKKPGTPVTEFQSDHEIFDFINPNELSMIDSCALDSSGNEVSFI